MNLIDIIIPFTLALFIVSVGVVLLYQNYQKNLIALELEKAEIEAKQRQELLQNSIMVQEQERKRIAQDLHDDLGAVISIIKMHLIVLSQREAYTETEHQPQSSIQNLISLSENAIESVRNISHQLMPPQLEAFGLVKALQSVVDQINKSGEIKFNFIQKTELPTIAWHTALGIYRVIMELINNTIKHAQAQNIFLEFNYVNNNLIIRFEDDGIGFPDLADVESGLGLISIDARVKAMNGQFEYQNRTEKGILSILNIPVS